MGEFILTTSAQEWFPASPAAELSGTLTGTKKPSNTEGTEKNGERREFTLASLVILQSLLGYLCVLAFPESTSNSKLSTRSARRKNGEHREFRVVFLDILPIFLGDLCAHGFSSRTV
jgi:hypothetical protein